MHLSHTPQCTILNKNVHIFVMNGALWEMGQVYCRISELGQFWIQQCRGQIRTFNKHWSHKRHLMACPHEQAMGCLLSVGKNWPCYKGTALSVLLTAKQSQLFNLKLALGEQGNIYAKWGSLRDLGNLGLKTT